MRYQLPTVANHANKLLLALFVSILFSCKKESMEIEVDAFAQLDREIIYTEEAYRILFTLQEYPYTEYGLRMSSNKELFHKGTGLSYYPVYLVDINRYGAFVNSLQANKIYYYQIYVKDAKSSKEVYSDVFSFTTNP